MLLRTLPILMVAMALVAGCSGGDDGGRGGAAAIPTFTGAELVPESVYSEGDAFSGSWRTTDDVPAVREYFERELADGDWRIIETREIADGVVIRLEDPDDPAASGSIIVRRQEGTTRIVEIIGRDEDDNDEDDRDAGGGSDVVEGLPQGYPDDVPLPADAQDVSGSAPLVGSSQYYLVEFSTTSTPEELIAYFNEALPAQGWQVGPAGTDPIGFALNFNRGADRVVVTGGGTAEGTEASITIVIQT